MIKTKTIFFEGLFHPGIKNAIDNDIHFDKDKNVIFPLIANMAGKSTLMKSIGTALQFAQMGFPVPAKNVVLRKRRHVHLHKRS